MSIVNNFQAYIDQNYDKLLNRAILGAESAKMFTLQTGVKTQTAINLLTTSVTLQGGADCGWNAAGTSTLTQRTITAPPVKINMPFCDKVFLNSIAQHDLKIAAGDKTLPFEAQLIDDVLRTNALQSEKLIWQGDTTSTNAQLAFMDGLIKILATDVPSGNKVGSGAAITSSNVRTEMDLVYAAILPEVLETSVIFCGYDTMRTFQLKLTADNLFHIFPDTGVSEMFYPGTKTKIKAVAGLNGTNVIAALQPEHTFFGTDLMGDAEKFKFWYSDDNQEFRLAINYSQGVQIAFPDQVIVRLASTDPVVPTAPVIAVVGGAGKATITITPAYDGGASLTNYSVSTDGGSTYVALSPASTATTIVKNLSTSATPYAITVKAINVVGSSLASNSVSVTVS